MKAYDRIKEILYGYETAGLLDGDPDKVLSYLTDDVIGIGMGEQGFISSREEIADIMYHTAKPNLTGEYSLEIKDIMIRAVTETTANLCARVNLKRTCQGKSTVSSFSQSLSFLYKEGDWKICALHASPIMLSEETVESYPLAFADHTLAKLKSELQKDTFELMNQYFSGGIMGIYAQKPYELFFANDKLLAMLGYEREEFERLFRENGYRVLGGTQDDMQIIKSKRTGEDFFERRSVKKRDGSELWVEICTRKSKDEQGTLVLLSMVIDVSEIVNLQLEAQKQNSMILSSIRYGSKIQRNLLPKAEAFKEAFADSAVIWEPKDGLGGDIYWLKSFEYGSVLAVGDCTGHGIPGALLSMLLVSVLDHIVDEKKAKEPSELLLELDQNMAHVLCGQQNVSEPKSNKITNIQDGCDIAILCVDREGNVKISASGLYIFLCDGREVKRIRTRKFYIGEGNLDGIESIQTIMVPGRPENRFYIASDGLFDQVGGEKQKPYGRRNFEEIILRHYKESQEDILRKVKKALEEFQGENLRRDDIEVISFVPYV